ncbi:Fe-S cluster assembly ATPase SufC [Candidatus Acetothermia bacterium]|nr:Fe-S cluster assembly ATPase SufC [Candidatus Acetothermia bacterium]MBI3642921.1 Fe-S cluster assembly ATPase SufC [Candidatus Acetothermia bacterium]
MTEQLEIKNLHVNVEGKEILKGLDLSIKKGEVHAIMGPNGSGKSTLAQSLMGHPKYDVTQGEVLFKGQNILDLEPDERARMGLFLAFQYPYEISGVPLSRFLLQAVKARNEESAETASNGKAKKLAFGEFRKLLKEKLEILRMDESFTKRYLNEGFSGGEKKRAEILQMLVLQPEIAILDETDSGLDIDSVKIVAEGVNSMRGENFGCLAITHYQRILNYLKPDYVHVMVAGCIVKSGDYQLARELEEGGYDPILEELGIEREAEEVS